MALLFPFHTMFSICYHKYILLSLQVYVLLMANHNNNILFQPADTFLYIHTRRHENMLKKAEIANNMQILAFVTKFSTQCNNSYFIYRDFTYFTYW